MEISLSMIVSKFCTCVNHLIIHLVFRFFIIFTRLAITSTLSLSKYHSPVKIRSFSQNRIFLLHCSCNTFCKLLLQYEEYDHRRNRTE